MRPIRIASCIALKLLPPPDTKTASFAGLRKLRGTGSSAACNCAQQSARFAELCRCLPKTKALRWQAPIAPGRESFATLRRGQEQGASLDDEQAPNSILRQSQPNTAVGITGTIPIVCQASDTMYYHVIRCIALQQLTIANRSCRLRNARLTPACLEMAVWDSSVSVKL